MRSKKRINRSSLIPIEKFSEITGVNKSTLRFYEKIGLISPKTRGYNNYRYYKPYQIIALNFINVLVSLGIPLEAIKNMNENRTPESILELLTKQEVKLNQQFHDLRTAYSLIHTFRDNIQAGIIAKEEEITVQKLDEMKIAFGEKTDFADADCFYNSFIDFYNSAPTYRMNLRYLIGGYLESMDTFSAAPGKPDKFFSLDPLGNDKREAGRYMVGYTRGYYGEFGDLPQRMVAYAQEHNFVFDGPVYCVYLLDEITTVDPKKYLVQVTAKVKRRDIDWT